MDLLFFCDFCFVFAFVMDLFYLALKNKFYLLKKLFLIIAKMLIDNNKYIFYVNFQNFYCEK